MMAEVGKLFIGVVMMVSEDDIVQLVLLDLFFQPMDILGEVFTFKSYSDVYLVVVFLTERLETLHVAGKLFGEHPHVGYVVGTVFPGSVVRKPEYPVTAFDGTEHIVFIISGGMHAACGVCMIISFHCVMISSMRISNGSAGTSSTS